MKSYLRNRIPAWLLCSAMGLALTLTFCSGFEFDLPGIGGCILLGLCCIVLELLLILSSINRRAMIAGIITGCIAALCCFLYARYQHPLDDEKANARLIAGLILAVCQLLIHLLTRTKPGTVCLLLMGILVCAFTQFLEFPAPAWSYFLFFAAGILMLLLRSYTVSVSKASMGSLHVSRLFLEAGTLTAAAGVLAVLFYAVLILPLNPPTQELRLIQTLQSMDIMQVLGVSTTRTVLDPTLRSDALPDVMEQDRQEETPEATPSPEQTEQPQEETTPPDSVQEETETPEEPEETPEPVPAQRVQYELPVKRTILFVMSGILLLIVMLLVLRIDRRRRWVQRVDRLSNEDAAVNYFRFFLRAIRRAGIPKPDTATLQEYVRLNEFELSAYDTESVSFGNLAAIYERCVLGGSKVSDEELTAFRAYYREFYHNLRQELGFRRYWVRFLLH